MGPYLKRKIRLIIHSKEKFIIIRKKWNKMKKMIGKLILKKGTNLESRFSLTGT